DEGTARAALNKATADKAQTDKAAKLDSDAATVRARLAKASPVASAADPGAAALAALLLSFGLTVPTGLVAQWLVLVGVIALELASALSVVLIRAAGPAEMRSVVELSADSRAEAQPDQPQSPAVTGAIAPQPGPKAKPADKTSRTRRQ